jgi:hypothetical protein
MPAATSNSFNPNPDDAGATVIQLRSPKPAYQAPNLAAIPDALKNARNWGVRRAEAPKPGKPKWRKMPYTPLEYDPKKKSAIPADTAKSARWPTYDEAGAT